MTGENRVLSVLKRYWGYDSFRPGQREIIERILAGESVLGVLSTGGGKSITYQLPALILPGITLVVSPLISLMVDQVQRLRANGHGHAAYLNSALSGEEVKSLLAEVSDGRYKLLYISPEKLRQPSLVRLLNRRGVSLVAVDEAHCISQWGHDFRTDYLRLPQAVNALGNPPVLTVTATATPEVQQEICALFHIPSRNVVVQSIDRANLTYDVIPVSTDQEKRERLLQDLRAIRTPAIVYAGTRQTVEELSAWLRDSGLSGRVHGYHGGMTSFERMLIQEQFLRGELDVMVATNAFGMGIDKADIRSVYHYHFPPSLEAYLQEVGRIGRDGEPGYACLYYLPEDVLIHARLLDSEFPSMVELETFVRLVAGHPENKPLTLHQLQSVLPMSETGIRLLFFYAEQTGLVEAAEAGSDGFRFRPGPVSPGEARELMADALLETRTNKERKLQRMIRWLEQSDCLRAGLGQYFGEVLSPSRVGHCCSNCGVEREAFAAKTADSVELAEEWSLAEALARLLPPRQAAQGGGGGR